MDVKRKKGQAALEFLMTYGWAFLVVLIMIGALAYFGVLNPSKMLPARCLVTPGFDCPDYTVEANGTTDRNLQVILVNQVGKSVTFQNFILNNPDDMTLGTCTVDSGAGPQGPPYQTIAPSIQFTLFCPLTGGNPPNAGDKMKIEIDAIYILSGTLFNRSSGIEIFEVVI